MSCRGALRTTLSIACAALLSAACSEQSVAERCNTLNRNEDCESGLVCVSAAQLQSVDDQLAPAGLCCPPPEQLAGLDPACIRRSALGDAGSSTNGGASDAANAGSDATAAMDASSGSDGATTPAGDASAPADAASEGP